MPKANWINSLRNNIAIVIIAGGTAFAASALLSPHTTGSPYAVVPAATTAALASGAPSTGALRPAIKVVEFADYECPYCGSEAPILEAAANSPGSSVRLYFRNFPLPNHAWAAPAAQAGYCIGKFDPDSFWRFYKYVYSSQQALDLAAFPSALTRFLSALPIAVRHQVLTCAGSAAAQQAVLRDRVLGERAGVSATPTIFVGRIRVTGAISRSELARLIRRQTGYARHLPLWPLTLRLP